MIKSIRETYNKSFSTEKYNSFIDDLNKTVGHDVKFRVAETPVFIDKIFKNKLIEAGTDVMSILFEKTNIPYLYALILPYAKIKRVH